MKGYPIQFNVFAETQEEADRASAAIKDFISFQAGKGVAVTANKLTEAARKWKDNYFVTSYFK